MCDSVVVDGRLCAAGKTVFGKASDRSANEPQPIVFVPAADHAEGERVKCTYIEVEQAAHTNAMILSKPSWIWGAEIGVNEHGLCIGNEAVFTKETCAGEPALLGMDILRLALERAATAREAVDVIGELMEKYGQGGNCGFDKEFYYDNAYLIADKNEIWHVETAGKHLWAAKKIEGAYSISNYITIDKPDIMHKDVISYAEQKGYEIDQPFDFAQTYIDWATSVKHSGIVRRSCSLRIAGKNGGEFNQYNMMNALRAHYATDDAWTNGRNCVCMHSGPNAASETTSAMVAVCDGRDTLIWATGMGVTCVAPFQPCWFDAYSKKQVFAYDDMEAGIDTWLKREGISRAMLAGRICESEYKAELYAMEADWHARVDNVSPDRESRQALCDAIADEAEAFIDKWLSKAAMVKDAQHKGDDEFVQWWQAKNAELGRDRRIAK